MFTLMVTGGLGSGKSTAVRYFADRGAATVSTDDIAQAVLDDPEVVSRIAGAFGDAVLDEEGRVSRSALALAAFAGPEHVALLNRIVHPKVVVRVRDELEAIRGTGGQGPAVVEVPLLVEAPELLELADAVLAITAPEEVRIERAAARGIPEHDARRRIASQATDDQRARIADAVVANPGSLEEFEAALSVFYAEKVEPQLGAQK